MNNKVIILQSPQFRYDIIDSFKDLADKDLQLADWLDKNYKHPYWDSLLYCVLNTIYNDHDLDELKKCESKIGIVFYNEEEAIKVWKFCSFFRNLLDSIGSREADEAYLNHPEWPKIWSGAADVSALMKANNEKYDIHASWDAWHKSFSKS